MIPSIQRVYDAYKVRRRMLHPSWRGDNQQRWAPCWRAVAELLEEHKDIDLDLYMNAQFELHASYPMPNQLYGPKAMERYTKYMEESPDPVEDVMRRLEVEMYFLETRKTMGLSLDDIFGMPASPLTPLFCFTVAQVYGRVDLVERYREGADAYLAAHPAARPIYAALLGEGEDGSK